MVRDMYTNSIEGVSSLFTRSTIRTVHEISVKHLDRYLEDMEWRVNNRNNPYMFRDTVRRILTTDTLPYRALVDGKAA